MDYIRNLDAVKCLVIIFRVILLWNSEGSVETENGPENWRISRLKQRPFKRGPPLRFAEIGR